MKQLQHIFTQAALALTLAIPATAEISEGDIEGWWLTEEGEAIAEIRRCGNEMCGEFTWMESGPQARGKDGQPICGQVFIYGLTQDDPDDCWEGGTIHDARKSKTYALKSVCRNGESQIEITASLYGWMPGLSQDWRRVLPGDPRYPDCRSHVTRGLTG